MGAGFATGKEINVYFHGKSLLSPLLSAALIGGFTALFLFIARSQSARRFAALDALTGLAAATVFVAMAGCIKALTTSSILGVCTAFSAALIARRTATFDAANLVLVLVIILAVIALSFGATVPQYASIGLFSAITYSTMNFMTAARIILTDGAGANGRDIAFVSLGVALVLGVLTALMYVATDGQNSAIPLLGRADALGLEWLALLVIYPAVFTTQLATARVVQDCARLNGIYGAGVMLGLSCLGAALGFDRVVRYGYPFVSMLGAAYVLGVIIIAFYNKRRGPNARSEPRSLHYPR